MQVAIQGGKASFHDVASFHYFGEEATKLYCNTFREVCRAVKEGKVDYGLMAIENSIAGSILGNYKLIHEYNMNIVGEIQLRIQQNLMVLPGVDWRKIEIVKSHPVALLQCEDFFLAHPAFRQEEYHDTADSAKYIRENNLTNHAAIASKQAADYYGLIIPEQGESIETEKKNFTRFFVLSANRKQKVDGSEKATLSFQLLNKVGTLSAALEVIVNNSINLTKIQSIPLLGHPEEYTFYVDCEWTNYEDFKKALAVKSFVNQLHILGEYKKGKIIL